MNFPVLLIEVPHQAKPTAYPLWDRSDFNRVFGDQVCEWLDRQAETLDLEEDQPTPGLECCEENDDVWMRAIGSDLHTVVLIESADEAADWITSPRDIHQGHRISALISEEAPSLWPSLEPKDGE